MTEQPKPEQGTISIHTENIFPIIKKWLYSEKEIFLRELVSNAVDAIHKLQHINLIEFGRAVCMARSPKCDECPLKNMCPSAGKV